VSPTARGLVGARRLDMSAFIAYLADLLDSRPISVGARELSQKKETVVAQPVGLEFGYSGEETRTTDGGTVAYSCV